MAKVNGDGGLRNAECGMRNAESGMRNAECGMREAECGMWKAECGVQNAEMRKAKCQSDKDSKKPSLRCRGKGGLPRRKKKSFLQPVATA